jgi:hypothetical protein
LAEHGGILDRIETAGARCIVGKFNPAALKANSRRW